MEMKHLRLHVIGLPHTKTTKEYLTCAFTQKVLNFCKMMKSMGHEVYHYGAEGSDESIATEHITVISDADQKRFFGDTDTSKLFYPIKWDDTEPYWQLFNGNTIGEMMTRVQKEDIICIIGGNCQQWISVAFPQNITTEFGIGYRGTFAKHRVFESYAWMHFIYGNAQDDNGQFFDQVIPNYFDPNDFHTAEKEDYLLFIGRMIRRKGPDIAIKLAETAGLKLKMAGQGVVNVEGDRIITQDPELTLSGQNIEYVGTVDVKQRAELMAKARAVIVPTTYLEPFGGVVIESLLSGTPVITTDFGAFPELIRDGENGYRFRTIGEGAWALKNLDKLQSPEQLRHDAIEKYSMDIVKYRYQDYFEQLLKLWDKGFFDTKYTPFKRQPGSFK